MMRETERPERNKGNEALRELAGRIKSLSYRDMQILEKRLVEKVENEGLPMAEALLLAADELETA